MFAASDDLRLAHELADTADAISAAYFLRDDPKAETKPDDSPVTEADLVVEAALRSQLGRHRPGDAFLGEETGAHGQGERRWLVDAIDGTTSFLARKPEWSTLIAVEERGSVTMGLVTAPALRRRWWATRGGGAWTCPYDRIPRGHPTALAVTATAGLDQASAAIWPAATDLAEPRRGAAARLASCCASVRPGERPAGQPAVKPSTATGTCHGALLVATGQVDLFLLTGGGPWDLAAVVPIVEEAGGRFSDVSGGRSLDAGAAVFTNGTIHDQVLRCLHKGPRRESEAYQR